MLFTRAPIERQPSQNEQERERPGLQAREWGRQLAGVRFSFARHHPALFGASNGDRRTLRPTYGHVIAGVMGVFSVKGQLSRLALLEQPRHRFPADCPRVDGAIGTARDLNAEKFLWREALPGPHLVLSECHRGYWTDGYEIDLTPMESLIFAQSEEEWATITSVSGDMHMGGFRVEYSDRQPRTVGPRCKTMHSMEIDGAKGERITFIIYFVFK